MPVTAREFAKREEFDLAYRQCRSPAMQAIEREVCGCDFCATSWATRSEADLIAEMLGLRPGMRLLELGAGSGWPALYLTERSGCRAVLTDLPPDGLSIAVERAAHDGLAANCLAAIADAGQLPFGNQTFEVVNHSDVLCCLTQKREVLAECRRVIRPGGRMAFSVIYVNSELAANDYARALAAAPEFVETDEDYPTLLTATQWTMLQRHDLTEAFFDTCSSRLHAEENSRQELVSLIGGKEFERRQALMECRISALQEGLLKRELFLTGPTAHERA